MKHCRYAKIHALSFGFAFGVLGGIMMFIMGLFAMVGHGVSYVNLTSSVYVGYGPTFLGSLIGAIWGFLEMFVFGVLFAALYNCFVCKAMRHQGWQGSCHGKTCQTQSSEGSCQEGTCDSRPKTSSETSHHH